VHREFQPGRMGAQPASGHHHDHHGHDEHDHAAELRALVATTVVVGLLLGLDILFGLLGLPYQTVFGTRLALLAAVIGGGRIVFLAFAALLEGRIGADIALAIATIAAGLAGEYFVAAEVVFIALVGECLEAFTFERAQRSIQKVLEYRPQTARVLRGSDDDLRELEIPVEGLALGDRIVVRPGERIAADGVVVSGRSAVDQAVLTGESLPVDKGEGDPVYTGTYNQFGQLVLRVQKLGAETTLGQVIKLLADAQARKSPLERTADRYARMFLPIVLTAALIVFLGTNASVLWSWRQSGRMAAFDVMPALAVLVVTCPCALILATPAAMLAATARLARKGVLVKGGAAIERLARVDAFAFDKTGTLTEGRPEIGDIHLFHAEHHDERAVLALVAAAEQPSEHPLARLVVNHARSLGVKPAELAHFQAHPGAGVEATLLEDSGRAILVGNVRLIREQGQAVPDSVEQALTALDASGQTPLLVAVNGRILGAIGVRDRVRREAHDVIHDLKHLDLKDLTILTGDRLACAKTVGKKVHVKQVEAELTPQGKAEWVRRRQEEGKVVAMMGDGINDAPALAAADVGLALGGVGADIAAEAGSIVMMGAPLEPLPEAIRLARQTVRVIRQNILIFAFGLNGLAILLAALRVLGPIAAAILHQVGSLLVLLNAIRLLGFERWGEFPILRAGDRLLDSCRSCRPSSAIDWAWTRRRALVRGGVLALILAYLGSGLTIVEQGELGVLQRFGRFEAPLLPPGLHIRWPYPVEWVTKVEPDLVRVARVGLGGVSATERARGSVAWSASHGARRDESALFFTGDENMVELSALVEYRFAKEAAAGLLFNVASVENGVAAAAEGAFREAVGRTALEDILAAHRGEFEAEVGRRLRARLAATGLNVTVDQIRVVDAHPPREVVPAYRDVSAAVSDAERYRNEAEAYASEQRWQGKAEAQARRDAAAARAASIGARAEGERAAFTAKVATHSAQPELTEFRLLWTALASAYTGRPKLLLDPQAAGRRHVWLTEPGKLGAARVLEPEAARARAPQEPED
jgi:P-type Cu+ transporter